MSYLTTDDVDSIGDGDISQILGLNTTASKQDRLALQMKLANALRQKGTEKGQMAGAVYIPPNPIDTAMDTYDHLSSILGQGRMDKQGNDLDDQRQAAINRYARLFFGKGKNAADPALLQDPNDQSLSGFVGPSQ